MTAHIHADLIKQWADDPTIEIEGWSPYNDEWEGSNIDDVLFKEYPMFRIKPKDRTYKAEIGFLSTEGLTIEQARKFMDVSVIITESPDGKIKDIRLAE